MDIDWIDWGDAAGWAAFVIAVVSAFFAGRSVREAKKARVASERSADAGEASALQAKRSADAGEVSAQAAVRSADAAEKSHQLAERAHALEQMEKAQEDAAREVVWVVEQPGGKGRFLLRNLGTRTATGVTIDKTKVSVVHRQLPDGVAVRPGEAHEFLLTGSWGNPLPSQVWVSWDGQDEAVAVSLPAV